MGVDIYSFDLPIPVGAKRLPRIFRARRIPKGLKSWALLRFRGATGGRASSRQQRRGKSIIKATTQGKLLTLGK